MPRTNSVLKSYIAATAIAYTIIVIISCLWNLIANGPESSIGCLYFVEIFGYIILVELIDWILSLVISKVWLYLVIDYAVAYGLFMGAGLALHWFGPSVKNISVITLLFICVAEFLYRYFLNKQKGDADSINKKLGSSE